MALDPSGKPAANVLVAVRAGRMLDFKRAVPAATTRTGPDGRFRLPLSRTDAREIVTASLAGSGAARWGPEHATVQPLTLELTRGIRLSGLVQMPDGKPAAGARVRAVTGTLDEHSSDFPVVFPGAAGADGTFTLEVPRDDEYIVVSELAEYTAPPVFARERVDAKFELRLAAPERGAAADDARVAAWIRTVARSMSVDGPSDSDDLAPVDAIAQGARVIALGEHSHGTREFHAFRHRVFRRLVERHGFTVLALEGSSYQWGKFDRFVQKGEGDPEAMLASAVYLGNSRDLLAQLKWMRAWNADERHVRKVKLVGFDVWSDPEGGERLRHFLERVHPENARLLGNAIAEMTAGFKKTTAPEIAVADLVVRALDDRARSSWKIAVSEDELQAVRRDARLLASHMRVMHGGSIEAYWQRDPRMAANVRALLAEYPGAKILLYAHGAHVARGNLPVGVRAMGSFLGEALGDEYRTIGLVFGEGSYWTFDYRLPKPRLSAVTVGPAAPRTFEWLLGQAGPSYFIDFRSAPPDVGQWLAHPKLMRDADEGFTDEESLEVPFPPGAYDAMFYVARSTPLARLSPPPPID